MVLAVDGIFGGGGRKLLTSVLFKSKNYVIIPFHVYPFI